MDLHPASLSDTELLTQCRIENTRSGGPGGQRRNKVETAVRITHNPTQLQITASERRSRAENLKVATFRLRMALAMQIRTPPGQSPSQLWQSRCHDRKISCNPLHQDYPALLAEAFDMIVANQMQIGPSAKRLALGPSQLIKFIKKSAPAWSALQSWRQHQGLKTLH